ncbi:MAG: VanZ family protein [Terriglobales bacterium]
MRRVLLRAWIPVALWTMVIALESTGLGSATHTSWLVMPLLRFFFPHASVAQLEFAHDLLRKAGHFTGYGLLSLLLFRAWWTTFSESRSPVKPAGFLAMLRCWSLRAALLAVVCTAAVAGLDEWHQTMLPGRTGTVHDVVLDSMAAAFVQLVLIGVSDVKKQRLAIGD